MVTWSFVCHLCSLPLPLTPNLFCVCFLCNTDNNLESQTSSHFFEQDQSEAHLSLIFVIQGILLVYDITNKWSFDGIDRWIKEVNEVIFSMLFDMLLTLL